MIAIRYVPAEHGRFLTSWLEAHGLDGRTADGVPQNGYIAIDKEPVAVAFLRVIEGNCAMLDGLTSNPKASKEQRHKGIDLVVSALIDVAKKAGIESIIAYSLDESTLKRSKRHGFTKLPHTLIALTLGASNGISKRYSGDQK